MQKDSRILDDLTRLASGAAGTLMDIRREVETMVASRVESLLARTPMVSREEFEAVREMARKAREENELLKERVKALESGQH